MLYTSVRSVGPGALRGSPVSWAMESRGQSASRTPPSRSKKATAPCSNSVPTIPSVAPLAPGAWETTSPPRANRHDPLQRDATSRYPAATSSRTACTPLR